MVGSPGKRAMLADMWESGQCGVRGFGLAHQHCVGSNGLIASKLAPTGQEPAFAFVGASLLAKAISLPTLIANL
ncbi:hypothetical protein DOZ80_26475 [Pseudomonas fluorescens]|uniref:Uncharacterized protein n=1 Tax=Pseudomonas fluorescens TaxID=294 RepID=A0A327MNZ7_PSEFL|nr:hypothetical protein DOZ80_26475 [Pseudomonas fluorescens]